jgi:hypothetical protein
VGARMVGRRGNAAVEFGLMAPLLLALLAFSFDFGAVYSERNRLGMAAQAGADAAAWALAAEDLSAAGVPASAEAAARESVRLALGGSLAGVSVNVTWAGPPSQEEQDLPGYALAVDVPRVENVEQVLDTTHQHTFSWQVPTFRQRTDWVAHRFPLSWSDNTNPLYYVTAWLRSAHLYRDRFDNPMNGTPSGPAFGFGGAFYFGYWQSWQDHPWIMGLLDADPHVADLPGFGVGDSPGDRLVPDHGVPVRDDLRRDDRGQALGGVRGGHGARDLRPRRQDSALPVRPDPAERARGVPVRTRAQAGADQAGESGGLEGVPGKQRAHQAGAGRQEGHRRCHVGGRIGQVGLALGGAECSGSLFAGPGRRRRQSRSAGG